MMQLQYCRACALVFETIDQPSLSCHQCGRTLVPYEGVLSGGDEDPDEIDFDRSEDRTSVIEPWSEKKDIVDGLLEISSDQRTSATQLIRSPLPAKAEADGFSDRRTDSSNTGHDLTASLQEITQSIDLGRAVTAEKPISVKAASQTMELENEDDATKITRLDDFLPSDNADAEAFADDKNTNELGFAEPKYDGFLDDADPTMALNLDSTQGSRLERLVPSKPVQQVAQPSPTSAVYPRPRALDQKAPPPPPPPIGKQVRASVSPDPSPKSRPPRPPKSRESRPPIRAQRTMDQAAPRPINLGHGADDSSAKRSKNRVGYPLRADSDSKKSIESESIKPSLPKRSGGPDLIAGIVDSHLDEPVDSGAMASILPRVRGRRGDVFLRIMLVALIGLVAGVGVTIFIFGGPRTVEENAGEKSGRDGIEAALLEAGLEAPAIEWAQEITHDQPYLIIGAQRTFSSEGSVEPLSESDFRRENLKASKPGFVLPDILSLFEGKGARRTLVMGLSSDMSLSQYATLGRSALASGFAEAALLVQRSDGRYGLLPIGVTRKSVPSVGQVVVSIGSEKIAVDVLRRDGSQMSDSADPPLTRHADGRLDLRGLDLRLGQLSKRFPRVKVALIKLDHRMTIAEAMPILTRIRFGQNAGEERFTTLRISLYE